MCLTFALIAADGVVAVVVEAVIAAGRTEPVEEVAELTGGALEALHTLQWCRIHRVVTDFDGW